MKQIFTISAFLFISNLMIGQSIVSVKPHSKDSKNETTTNYQNKLVAGESIVLSPNPVSVTEPLVQIIAINVSIFSYHVFNSMGQIVEIENLSGRPDPTWFKLPDGSLPGIYYIKFDTDSGFITRKLLVQ